jgi:hypothetical protein
MSQHYLEKMIVVSLEKLSLLEILEAPFGIEEQPRPLKE